MSIDLSILQGLYIPEGEVIEITDANGTVIWAVQQSSSNVILEVEKITSDTYAGETTYTGEQFILLDIYPKTNGTVSVTYGGLTKTITDTSGAEEPNAQQVFFGTFNGVSDSVATPASGTLTIEGDYAAFSCGNFNTGAKSISQKLCVCVTEITDFGAVEYIPSTSFYSTLSTNSCEITRAIIPKTVKRIDNSAFYMCGNLIDIKISDGVTYIGNAAFYLTALSYIEIPSSVTYIGTETFSTLDLETAKILAVTPPQLGYSENNDGSKSYNSFGTPDDETLKQIIVPKGCGDTYKVAEGWSVYADIIVEES